MEERLRELEVNEPDKMKKKREAKTRQANVRRVKSFQSSEDARPKGSKPSEDAKPSKASHQAKMQTKRLETKRARQSAQAKSAKTKTYDWALDLEPLALPPDLPPVILKE